MAQSNRPELGEFIRNKTGIRYTYFNPPSSIHMEYPCVVYSRDNIDATFADNDVYKLDYRYQLILIDRDPDSQFVEQVAQLPQCRFVRHYNADNLSHDVFRIYYK